MASSSYCNMSPIIPIFVGFLLVSFSALSTSIALQDHESQLQTNQTFKSAKELQKLNRIRAHLGRINKPSVKTIKSPDGDLIDCVPSHLQPAFDHPKLKGQKPLDPPEMPKGYEELDSVSDGFRVWMNSSESCPEGTIPIRRTTEEDMLRAGSIERFGRKPIRPIRRDTLHEGHEYASGFVEGGKHFGAKVAINIWSPHVASPGEFSVSQLWLTSGSSQTLDTIEAGWQVYPSQYRDNRPRFFVFWTADGYRTGCYNLVCSGFVQTSKRVVVGGALAPVSKYNGGQAEIILMVHKDRRTGNWWLRYGDREMVGYWPSILFNGLRDYATKAVFGGEILNKHASGLHTTTQMGSGHFPGEDFKRASYFRNIQVVNQANSMVDPNVHVEATKPNCYDIKMPSEINKLWGRYFYYGGPGRNGRCP